MMERLSVFFERGRLDRDLAAGMLPWQTARHERRATQLVSTPTRRALATSLETVLVNADEPADGLPVSAARVAVARNRRDLRVLAEKLRDGPPVRPQGVALVRRLVAERTSPLYVDNDDRALERCLHDALSTLEARRDAVRRAA
jgi:hypothetical protein